MVAVPRSSTCSLVCGPPPSDGAATVRSPQSARSGRGRRRRRPGRSVGTAGCGDGAVHGATPDRLEEPQIEVRHADRDGDDGDDQPVLGELPERDLLAGAFGDAEHDDVGRCADRGGVAAEVRAQRQGPPQDVALRGAVGFDQVGDDRAHRRDVGDVVHDRRY